MENRTLAWEIRRLKDLLKDRYDKLLLHDWPGNVRELENTIEYAMNMTCEQSSSSGGKAPNCFLHSS